MNRYILSCFASAWKRSRAAAPGCALWLACLHLLPAAQTQAAGTARKKPNVIVIMSDDHAYQAISAYSPDLISTPHIDRIAREGALMKKAYVTNSICGPSRAVLLTGKYSHINGFTDNVDRFNGAQQTFPKIFRAQGYKTAIVGKWHLESEPEGFDYWNILPGQGNYYNPGFIKMGKDTTYAGYVTDITTDLGLSWIQENKGQPFVLMLHQKAPHRNQMPPLENLHLFRDRQFSMPANFFDTYQDRQALQRQNISMRENLDVDHDSKTPCRDCPKGGGWKWNPRGYAREVNRLSPLEKEKWDQAYQHEYARVAQIKTKEERMKWQFQRYMQDYLRCIKSVDDNVGRVLKYLDEQGLAENTIVIYTSDQGVFLGEHGLYDKRFMYEESFRTPLMIRYPKGIKAGRQVEQMVLNLDLAPTLLDLAGLDIPADMQGASMKKLLQGKKVKDWRQQIYYHYYGKAFGLTAHYGIRTNRYKLIRFYDPVSTWELYDLQSDPQEMQNLIGKPEHAALAASLKKELSSLQLKYKDQVPTANNNHKSE
ncbi:MAG: sulfatase [Adhaeribacter sp.]